MKRVKKIVLYVVIGLVVVLTAGITYLNIGMNEGKKAVVGTVDVSQTVDGSYVGSYKNSRWSNQVNVTVVNHRITAINIEKTVLIEQQDVTEKLINDVLAAQNTDVEIISGATVTSKAYLKSIENALSGK